jgi:HlyD family secretion protein
MLRHALAGLAVIVVLLGGLGVWAARTDLAGAIIAHGIMVVSSDTKKVQHSTGGIVRQIFVRNGSVVKAGDVLLTLDQTVLGANFDLVSKGLTELMVRRARLVAERDSAPSINFPPLESLAAATAETAMRDEMALFQNRRAVNQSVKNQLRQRIQQTQEELSGLQAQLDAKAQEISLVAVELKGARELWGKALLPITKYTALQREAARLGGERGQLVAALALAKGKITETELKLLQIDQDLASDVGKELRETDFRINELVERKVAATDQLRRATIAAPQAGIVHEMTAHTAGGVISPGDTIMLIVPQEEPLMAELRIQPQDIDQIAAGQETLLRFSAFNQNLTPDCQGELRQISPDLTTDARTGVLFYVARVELKSDQTPGLGALKLLPGMPVEAFIRTGDRTVFSYLIKPLTDQIARALRDS